MGMVGLFLVKKADGTIPGYDPHEHAHGQGAATGEEARRRREAPHTSTEGTAPGTRIRGAGALSPALSALSCRRPAAYPEPQSPRRSARDRDRAASHAGGRGRARRGLAGHRVPGGERGARGAGRAGRAGPACGGGTRLRARPGGPQPGDATPRRGRRRRRRTGARIFADPYFAQQLRGISKEPTAHDNQLVLLLTEGREDHARVGRYLAGGHVDGALVFSLHLDDPLPGLVRSAGVPTVFGGRPGWDDGRDDVVYVDSDNRGGARDAVRHLAGLGRTRIAHITGPLDQTSAADRLAGFRDVRADADPGLIARGDFTPVGGERAMRNCSTGARTWTPCSRPTTSPRRAPCGCCARAGGGCRRTLPWSASTTCCPSPSRPTRR